jgi:hypothetical protein
MSDADALLERLHRLESPRLRAVAERLESSDLQSLVLQAARNGTSDDIELARTLLELRDSEGSSAPSPPTPPVDVAASPETTLLSWRDLEAVPGGESLTATLDGLLEMTMPIQQILRTSSFDAFGVELEGVDALLETLGPTGGLDWEVVVERALGDGAFDIELEATGLGLTWFGRGPHVRRRPFLYVVAGGGVGWGEDEPSETTFSPFVARYHGPEAEITADSWTEWFAGVSFGPERFRMGATDLSLSMFRSADGPWDVVRQCASDLSSIAGEMSAPERRSGWEGWSLEFHPGSEGGSRLFQLGSSFYG